MTKPDEQCPTCGGLDGTHSSVYCDKAATTPNEPKLCHGCWQPPTNCECDDALPPHIARLVDAARVWTKANKLKGSTHQTALQQDSHCRNSKEWSIHFKADRDEQDARSAFLDAAREMPDE